MKTDHTLTQARLRELFDYDPATGNLLWRHEMRRGEHVFHAPGDVAGCAAGHRGRRQIVVDGVARYAHRLVWLYVHGSWPAGELDHINGDLHDHRIENLRECTTAQNTQNKIRASKSNVAGLLGVGFDKRNGKYRARIMVGGKSTSLGYYATPEEADAAYRQAKRELHPFWVEAA